ncbi:Glycoside hydrolase, 38 vacuolar alpha mannosidase, partial [Marasmius sp. AFHP31]
PDSVFFTPETTKLPPDAQLTDIIAFNRTPFPRRDIVKIPMSGVSSNSNLRSAIAQVESDGSRYAIMDTSGKLDASRSDDALWGSNHKLARRSVGSEAHSKGVYWGIGDNPNYRDAWDVEIHHLETAKELKFEEITVVAHGPLRAAVKAQLK